jgi:hypothetical protein
MSNKIPIADEFLDQYLYKPAIPFSPEIEANYGAIHTAMVEFAKLHVKKALEAANNLSKEIDIIFAEGDPLLTVYPIENIK